MNKIWGIDMKLSSGTKIVVVSVVAGLIGGGVAAGGVVHFTQGDQAANVTTAKSNAVKVSENNVKGKSSATKAFKNVSGAVVSVINLQKQQSLQSDFLGIKHKIVIVIRQIYKQLQKDQELFIKRATIRHIL